MDHPKKQSFLLKMGELSTLFGFSHILGQIYGLLYLTPNELSLDEIKDSLGVSKATVSLTIRELLKWGAVKKIWKPGTRKDYYEAEADFLKMFNTRLVDALLRRVGVFDEAVFDQAGNVKDSNLEKKEKEFVEKRLKAVKKAAQFLKKILLKTKEIDNNIILKKFLSF